jgi:signal transduction histidine kinase
MAGGQGDRLKWLMAAMDALLTVQTLPQVFQMLAELAGDLGDLAVADHLSPGDEAVRLGGYAGDDSLRSLLRDGHHQWRHPTREVVNTARRLRGVVADDAGASRFATSSDGWRQVLQRGPLHYVFVPLKAADRIYGALGVGRFGTSGFADDDERLIEDLGARAGLVIQVLLNDQAAEQAKLDRDRQAALWQAVAASSRVFAEASRSVDDALPRISRLVSEKLGGVCAIRLLDEHGQWVSQAEVYHPDRQTQERVAAQLSRSMTLQEGVSARVIASGKSMFLAQLDPEDMRPLLTEPGQALIVPGQRHSLMCIPMRARGRSLGVIIVARADGQAYSEDDLQLGEELADLAGLAIDHARLHEIAQAARQQAESDAVRVAQLQTITALLAAAASPAEVLDTVLRQGGEALGAVMGVVATLSEDGCYLEAQGMVGVPEALRAVWEHIPLSRLGPMTEAVRSGELVLSPSVAAIVARYDWLEPHAESLPGAGVAVPLSAGGRPVGVMSFGFAGERALSDGDRGFVLSLAAQAAQALDRARLHAGRQQALEDAERALAQTQVAVERTESLQRLTADFSAAVTVEAISAIVGHEGVRSFGANLGLVFFLTESGDVLELVGSHNVPAAYQDSWRHLALSAGTPLAECVRLRQAVFCESGETWLARYPGAVLRCADWLGARIALPLIVHNRLIGCLAYEWQSDRPFSEEERQFLLAMAGMAAQAFERAQLYAEAREAVQMRDGFLSMASHELHTPLTSLKLTLDALVKKAVADPHGTMPIPFLQAKLQRLERQVGRLADLVVELLDVARAAQGRLPLTMEALDLREVVRDVADRYADELSRQGCALWLQCNPAVGHWDRSRLDQVVTNLLSNALKYGAGKPITITTRVEGDEAVLTVRDQGIGIAAENHERVFQRFERVVSGRHYGGFGLGLWIVREIVQAFGGQIAVDSKPDAGATFVVRLPLRPAAPV